jgi:hypothetical protein
MRLTIVKTAGVDEIAFDLSANGALSVVGQPKRPKDLTVTYSENQSETIVSWVAPSDATVTGYRVYSREEGHLNFSMDDQLAGNITNYTVGTPAVAADGSQSAREYVIVAISAIGKESFASALVSSRSIEVPHDIWLVRAEVQPMPQWVYSDPALVSGINVPVSVSIENGEYSIDGLPFTTDPGTVRSGQRIAVRVRAPDPADQSPRTGPRDQLPVASTASLSVGARVFFFSTALQPSITDPDNDGVDSVVESGVPNLDGGGTGDGNGDSIPDESHPYVASLPVSGSAYASLHVPSATALLNVQSMSPPSDSPAGVQFPYGMFRFIVTGVTERSTQVVALYVPYNTAINGYWKKNASGNWVNVATSITQQGNKTKVTFPLTEGDAFDFDTNPATITDPVGGPGILTLAANVVPVPTLSNWGKIMLLSLIAMCGALLLRRRGEALRRDI